MVFTGINYTDDFKILVSFHQQNKPYGKIESRKSHAFLFRLKGEVHYLFGEKEMTLREGQFIFIPKDTSYEYTVADSENSLYTSINFQASLKDASVRVYPFEVYHSTNYIAESFAELWKFGTDADRFKCHYLFFDLLSHVIDYDNLDSEHKRKHRIIEPGVEYLKRHIYDSDLRVDKLHHLCAVSDTYFRKIFTSKFGMTPQSYVLSERISHARSIIESGDYGSIREVSEAVGYNDSLYFGKAFKKLYGVSPTAYQEKIKNE